MIAIVDYGVGNLFSIKRSLEFLNIENVVTSDAEIIKSADRIILPGVGAFRDAADKLKKSGLDKVIVDEAQKGKPLLGICLGMQLLFNKSFEYGEYDGLNLISGEVRPLFREGEYDLKVPQIGWNSLKIIKPSPLLKYVKEGEYVYFVHSYSAQKCEDSVVAVTDYGATVTAVVQNGNVYGAQFHPEKSGQTGLNILKAFSEV